MSRVLIIGWDGADWRILDPLLERGDLPNLSALLERGGRAVLKAPLPNHSWSAWPSFMTGVEPADHGVYDILEARGGSKRQFPVTFRSIKERTFLADLTRAAVPSIFVNVPLTFPPPRIEGKLVAGGVLPKWRPFTHPESLAKELEEAGAPWPINGMSWTTFRNRPDAFLEEVQEFARVRQKATEHILDTSEWRVACVVQVETDRVQHCLSKYVSGDHPDYERLSREPLADRVRAVYRLLDEGLGRLVERTGPEDLVIFMSDHGFQSCTGAVHMDRLLEHFGFLEFSASRAIFGPMQWGPMRALARRLYDMLGLHGRVPLPQSINWSKTRAYTSVRSTGELGQPGGTGTGRHRRPRRFRPGSRRGRPEGWIVRRSSNGKAPRGPGLPAGGGVQGAVCRRCPRPVAAGRPAVQLDPREEHRGGRGLALRRSQD
jgi:predicted AlkP superfamily phosphohydrolase/phosphomutase